MSESEPLIVSVSGLRGIVGGSLTEAVAANFAGAFGTWLAGHGSGERFTIVAGRDGRSGGEAIFRAAIEALLARGHDVVDLGIAMTPTVGAMVGRLGAHAGLVCTASHNPQQWNGLKLLVHGDAGAGFAGWGSGGGASGGEAARTFCRALAPAEAAEVIAIFERAQVDGGAALAKPPSPGAHRVHEGSAQEHASMVREALRGAGVEIAPGGGLKVVVDSVNASGAEGAAAMLSPVAEVHQIAGDGSGVFPHTPEPTLENLSGAGGLCDRVRALGADVGFAQDPDADRLAIIDENGRYIGEEYTLALASMSVLEAMGPQRARGAVLCANLSTSRMIDDVAARYGARVVRTPVGEANVVVGMRDSGAVLGGEGNGGVIFPGVSHVRDSLVAMALVLALMQRTGETVSGLVRRIGAEYAIVKRKVDLARREESAPQLAALARAYAAHRPDVQDGVRIDLRRPEGSAWVHVRPSNTEPILRLIAEAPTREAAEALLDEVDAVRLGKATAERY